MTGPWVPRPPHPDEPACWSWPVPPLDGLDPKYKRRIVTYPNSPHREFMDWLIDMKIVDGGPAAQQFNAFHAGRCAICGQGADTVDHCHVTGQVRGWLCSGGRGCNLREGTSTAPIFARYRHLHPAAILGYYERHNGIGCYDGWPTGDHPAPWTLGPRPFTPWPAWSPGDSLDGLTPMQRNRQRRSDPLELPALPQQRASTPQPEGTPNARQH